MKTKQIKKLQNKNIVKNEVFDTTNLATTGCQLTRQKGIPAILQLQLLILINKALLDIA